MKGSVNLSPGVAAAVIVLVVAGIAFWLFKSTGSRGHVQLSPDQVTQMQQMMGQQKADNGANVGMMQRSPHSLPPPGTPTGK